MIYDLKKCEKVCAEALETVKALKNRNIKGKYDNSEEALEKAFASIEANVEKLEKALKDLDYLRVMKKALKLERLLSYIMSEIVSTENEDLIPKIAYLITKFYEIQNYYKNEVLKN